jgi:hypothetical protein
MLTKEQLQEAKNKAAQELRSYVNEHEKNWSKEDDANYERLNLAYDEATAAIDSANAAEQRASRLKQIEEDSKRVVNNRDGVGRQSKKLGFNDQGEVDKSRLALIGWAKGEHANDEERQAAIEAGIYNRSRVDVGAFNDLGLEEAQNDL